MHHLKKKPDNISGITLVELIIAITITALLVPSVFFIYLDFGRRFRNQTDSASLSQQAISARSKISSALERVGSIRSISENTIVFTSSADTLSHELRLRGGALRCDTAMVAKDLEKCIFSAAVRPDSSECLLLWEAQMAGHRWIGGAGIFPIARARTSQFTGK
jgi:hypothetical protein